MNRGASVGTYHRCRNFVHLSSAPAASLLTVYPQHLVHHGRIGVRIHRRGPLHAARLRARYACTRRAPRDFSRRYAVPFALMDFFAGNSGANRRNANVVPLPCRGTYSTRLIKRVRRASDNYTSGMRRGNVPRALIRRFLGSRSRVNDGECWPRRATNRMCRTFTRSEWSRVSDRFVYLRVFGLIRSGSNRLIERLIPR